MTWSLVGWMVIGLGVVLLLAFSFLFKGHKGYPVRRFPAVERLVASRVTALEQGKKCAVVLGHRFWSSAYPGLGLQALSILPTVLSEENAAEGGQVVAVGDGSLLMLARQIVGKCYRDGFSKALHNPDLSVSLPGMTPISFTAGLLPELHSHSYGALVLAGNYGPEAIMWAESLADRAEYVFAAAGTLSSQAALFPSVQDSLIGEEIFMLPGLVDGQPVDQAALLTEDILRIGCVLLLLVGVILKLAGFL